MRDRATRPSGCDIPYTLKVLNCASPMKDFSHIGNYQPRVPGLVTQKVPRGLTVRRHSDGKYAASEDRSLGVTALSS